MSCCAKKTPHRRGLWGNWLWARLLENTLRILRLITLIKFLVEDFCQLKSDLLSAVRSFCFPSSRLVAKLWVDVFESRKQIKVIFVRLIKGEKKYTGNERVNFIRIKRQQHCTVTIYNSSLPRFGEPSPTQRTYSPKIEDNINSPVALDLFARSESDADASTISEFNTII